jgi:hypothetical protein
MAAPLPSDPPGKIVAINGEEIGRSASAPFGPPAPTRSASAARCSALAAVTASQSLHRFAPGLALTEMASLLAAHPDEAEVVVVAQGGGRHSRALGQAANAERGVSGWHLTSSVLEHVYWSP